MTMTALAIDLPTRPAATCPPLCIAHYFDDETGVCFGPIELAPLGEVGVSFTPSEGTLIDIFAKTEDLTPAEARGLAAALLAQADRADRR